MLCLTVKQLQLIAQGNLQSARAPIMRRDDVNTPQWQGQKYLPQHSLADNLRMLLDGGAILIVNIRLAHHGVQIVQAAERAGVTLADFAGVGDKIARTIRNLGGRATQTHNKMPLPDRSEKGICIGVLAKIDGAQERAPVRIKSALLAETALNKSDQRVNGGNLVVALGTQLDLIVLGNTRGHDGNHGLSVLEVTILGGVADLNLRGKLSSLGRQRRCRASVQASGVNDHNVLAIHF